VRPLLAKPGGAKALVRLAASDNAGGFDAGEAIGAGMRVMAAELSMGQIQSVSHTAIGFVRAKVGPGTADTAVVATPGLPQLT
jgi:hypothetical protein